VKKFLSQLVYPKLRSEQEGFFYMEQQENTKVFFKLRKTFTQLFKMITAV